MVMVMADARGVVEMQSERQSDDEALAAVIAVADREDGNDPIQKFRNELIRGLLQLDSMVKEKERVDSLQQERGEGTAIEPRFKELTPTPPTPIVDVGASVTSTEDGGRARKVRKACETCGRRFNQPRCSTMVKMHFCKICGKGFWWRCHLKRHLRTAHAKLPVPRVLPAPMVCKVCSREFQYPSRLREHMLTTHRVVTPAEEKLLICEICGMRCSHMGNLRMHQRVHAPDRKVVCARRLSVEDDSRGQLN